MAQAFSCRLLFLTTRSLGKSIAELIFLLVIFILILVACVFTTKLVAGRQMQRNRNTNFEPLETFMVAQNRYLQLIRVGTRYFVISVTKERVELITELSKDDFTVPEVTSGGFSKSFKDILSDIKGKVEKHDEDNK